MTGGAEAKVAVFAYNFGASGKPAALQVESRIVGPDGQDAPIDLRADRTSDVERAGGQKRMFAFRTAGLAPGRYTLRIVVTDPATRASAESAGLFDVK
jgi:hypothetical protein